MSASSSTVAGVLREQTRERGEHPLLVCDADTISYAEAERRSARLAHGLISLEVGKGTHVGLLFPNGADFVVGMLAAMRIGAVVVPFSTFATARELREQLLDSDVALLLTAASYRSHDYVQRLAEVMPDVDLVSGERLFSTPVPQLRRVFIGLEGIDGLAETVDSVLLSAMEDDVDGSDPLTIVYTSGSTSKPKGVVHTHEALLGHQRNLDDLRGLTADVRLFCNSPFFWVGGIGFSVLATILAGATLLCSNAADPGEVLDFLEAERPTMTNGFAAGIAHLARHPSFPRRDLSFMRGGNLYPIMPTDVRPADPELRHSMLGMTETGSVNLLSRDTSDQPEHRRGSFGKPAPGFETRVVDPDTGEPAGIGQVGEFWVRGPYVMQRYHRRSREDCFDADGWFATGDLVRTDEDGFYYFIGRRGAMIKTAGANVSPPEVEKAIAKVTGGTVAHVIGLPDPERGQIVAAAVVVGDVDEFDEAALRESLRSELSAYKVPRRFIALTGSTVPLMSSGKVDFPALRKMFDG
jgi:acyl-CoA synthetase (AMP-forming)/AMP-acid ligase II